MILSPLEVMRILDIHWETDDLDNWTFVQVAIPVERPVTGPMMVMTILVCDCERVSDRLRITELAGYTTYELRVHGVLIGEETVWVGVAKCPTCTRRSWTCTDIPLRTSDLISDVPQNHRVVAADRLEEVGLSEEAGLMRKLDLILGVSLLAAPAPDPFQEAVVVYTSPPARLDTVAAEEAFSEIARRREEMTWGGCSRCAMPLVMNGRPVSGARMYVSPSGEERILCSDCARIVYPRLDEWQ